MKKALCLCILLHAALIGLHAQGCSDAGICTAPGFAPLGDENETWHAELKLSLESTEPGALLISPQITAGFKLTEKINASVKVPLWFVSDPILGSNYSFSDPVISATFLLLEKEGGKLALNAGTRIGVSNATANGLGDTNLPMDYQNSLGTTDLLLGLNYQKNGFSVTFGFQYPVWQYNQNQAVVKKYIDNPFISDIDFEYKRKTDIVLRLEKMWQFNNFYFRAGILPIYHVADDEIVSTTVSAVTTIDGSKGLTLNIPLGAWYTHNNWIFGLDVGFPVVTRKERPDGLTRKFVAQPRILYAF